MQGKSVLHILQDRFAPVPSGSRYWVRFSGSYTVANNQWQSAPFTFEDTLAAGSYAVIGMELQLSEAIAARLTFDDQVLRPGCICTSAAGQRTADMFYDGSLGEWGRFESYSPSRLELFATGSTTTFQGALYAVALNGPQNGGGAARL